MFVRILLLTIGIVFGSAVSAEVLLDSIERFDSWLVTIKVDDFEGEIIPELESSIVSTKGQIIGEFRIRFFVVSKGEIKSAFVSMYIKELDPTWPKCDYEFTKYRIDSSESKYFPTSGYACPNLIFDSEMASKFMYGDQFRFSASGRTGIVNLKGFKDAWSYVNARLMDNVIWGPID